ncbi:MAG: transglutaminase family protein [Fimbriimonadaceae bacterium]|jgi:transglutaminase-like putative cysteine protease|nr:transglutaminase family protein [Fimbriimonadaceae bacterium]
MLFELKHETLFEYSEPVTDSMMEFRLTPKTDAKQKVIIHQSRVVPARSTRRYLDGWGNTVTTVNIPFSHQKVEVVFESVVECDEGSRTENEQGSARDLALYDFKQPSRLVEWTPLFREFVQDFESIRDHPTRELAEKLSEAIHTGFRYDTKATTASSTIDDLLRGRAGVCQDFSHLMIGVARWLGVPARYVSGYVYSDRYQEQTVASHAWVELFDESSGWIGIDPTHNDWVRESHLRLGVGRDYQDVSPNRGLYRGSAQESVEVRVFLRPIDPVELEQSTKRLFTSAQLTAYATRQFRKPAPVSILQAITAAQQQQQQQQ